MGGKTHTAAAVLNFRQKAGCGKTYSLSNGVVSFFKNFFLLFASNFLRINRSDNDRKKVNTTFFFLTFILLETAPDGRRINKNGAVSDVILTVGTALKGILWESTAMPEIRAQANRLALSLLNGD